MCGLKPDILIHQLTIRGGTPHVGVWIETLLTTDKKNNEYVTPHVGVWIETATHWKTPSAI